jgi:hypothetical protein
MSTPLIELICLIVGFVWMGILIQYMQGRDE